MNSGAGRGFGIGAGFAIIGLVTGIFIGRTITAMAELGEKFSGKPSPEQAAQMQALRSRQLLFTNLTAAALLLATVFMSAARYFTF
jgi:Na+/glutamate symporter